MSLPATQNADQTAKPARLGRVRKFARRAIITYLLIVVGMMFLETYLVYPIPPLTRHNWKPVGFEYEDLNFQSAEGTKLNAWFFPNSNTKRAVLYCHGNGEDVAADADLCAHLSNRRVLDANVLVFDYRGYGHSEGTPNEAGCIADGSAAQKWLAKRVGIEPNEVILLGRSLGSGVATALAADNGCQALVLENAFPSMVSIAARQYPWLPVRWVMRNRYDNLARIARYDGPLFQSHGSNDELIPIAAALTLFDAAPTANKKWLEYPNCGHNDPRPMKYYTELSSFLDQIPKLQNPVSAAQGE